MIKYCAERQKYIQEIKWNYFPILGKETKTQDIYTCLAKRIKKIIIKKRQKRSFSYRNSFSYYCLGLNRIISNINCFFQEMLSREPLAFADKERRKEESKILINLCRVVGKLSEKRGESFVIE